MILVLGPRIAEPTQGPECWLTVVQFAFEGEGLVARKASAPRPLGCPSHPHPTPRALPTAVTHFSICFFQLYGQPAAGPTFLYRPLQKLAPQARTLLDKKLYRL